MCAGEDGKDSCSGDSGGPLTVIQNGTFIQIGLVHSGTVAGDNQVQCGANGNYGVYTDVFKYRSFIDSVLAGNSSASLFINFFLLFSILLFFFWFEWNPY